MTGWKTPWPTGSRRWDPNRNGCTSRKGENTVIIPLGLTTGVYVLLAAGLAVRGYGRWLRRMWRRSL